MSNDFVTALFLVAFWLPPLAVIIGALAVWVPARGASRTPIPFRAPRLNT
jgi:hypothetical protein